MESTTKEARMAVKSRDAIQFYSAATANGIKVAACLEELVDLRSNTESFLYEPHTVDIRNGETRTTEFANSIAPHGKIPVLFDPKGPAGTPVRVFESGSCLLYLADKYHELIPSDDLNLRQETINWLFWGSAALSSQVKLFGFYYKYCPHPNPYCVERYSRECVRLLNVLENQLNTHGKNWVVGDMYTIADISIWPWVHALHVYYDDAAERIFDSFKPFPNVRRWYGNCLTRPASKRSLDVTSFVA